MGDDDSKRSAASALFKDGAKPVWQNLPKTVKIKIICIVAVVVFFGIILMSIFGSFNFSALDYSNKVSSSDDIEEIDKEFLDDLYDICNEEDVECQDYYKNSRNEFYNQFNDSVRNHKLNSEQKNILLSTLFLDYDIDEVFTKEKDNIDKLAKQFKSNENDNESYYQYLKTSDYFDERDNLNNYFAEYAALNNKSVSDLSSDDKVNVRTMLCNYISGIVEDYIQKEKKDYNSIVSTASGYWWPIGSLETTVEGGKIFASGDPQYTKITSNYGKRYLNDSGWGFHYGIDIAGNANSTNVIASYSGEVVAINNSCNSISTNSPEDRSCGSGYGNYVFITDDKGNKNIYAHLYRNTITVSVGDRVTHGEVIAKVGSSGHSTGPHLHFEIRINGDSNKRVNPLEYVDPKNPRPITSGGEFDFFNTIYSESEFVSIVTNYYSQSEVCKSSDSDYTEKCNDLKDDIINGNGAEIIYRVAMEKNRNPELVIPRMMLEGYSPGNGHNYFGYACYNTNMGYSCINGFSSFEVAMEEFYNYASKYSNLYDMMATYAYLGDYWYANVDGGSSFGGCYYASYIYPTGIPSRVIDACNQTTCTPNNTEGCVKTTQEDIDAYTAWQEKRMIEVRKKIFK